MEPISIDVHVVATVYKYKCIVDAFISRRHSIYFFKRRNFEDVRRRLQIDQIDQKNAGWSPWTDACICKTNLKSHLITRPITVFRLLADVTRGILIGKYIFPH